MKYLRKFENREDIVEHIYDGGWLDPNVPAVDYVVNNDTVYYSGVYGADENTFNVPPGYIQLEYVENTGSAYVDFSDVTFDNSHILNIVYMETTEATSVPICNTHATATGYGSWYLYHDNSNNFYGVYIRDNSNTTILAQIIYHDTDQDGLTPGVKTSLQCYTKIVLPSGGGGHTFLNNAVHIECNNLSTDNSNYETIYNNDISVNLTNVDFTGGNSHIRLFAYANGGSNFKGRIYYVSLGNNKNGAVMQREYTTYEIIPAKEISTDIVGFILV